jgi:hypothetical protein
LKTKKCRNCLRRVSLHWNLCPWCKHSGFSFNEEYLYNEGSEVWRKNEKMPNNNSA